MYQKAYIEFFASPDLMKAIVQVLHRHPTLNFNAINSEKVEISSGHKSVTGAHLLVCSCHSTYTVAVVARGDVKVVLLNPAKHTLTAAVH